MIDCSVWAWVMIACGVGDLRIVLTENCGSMNCVLGVLCV